MGPTVGPPESASTYVSLVLTDGVSNKKSTLCRIRTDGIGGTVVERVPWTSWRLKDPRVRHWLIVSMRLHAIGYSGSYCL